jgi:hypothetical protein
VCIACKTTGNINKRKKMVAKIQYGLLRIYYAYGIKDAIMLKLIEKR